MVSPAHMGGLMINTVFGTASATADLRREPTSSIQRARATADRTADAYNRTAASFNDELDAGQSGGLGAIAMNVASAETPCGPYRGPLVELDQAEATLPVRVPLAGPRPEPIGTAFNASKPMLQRALETRKKPV
jgi:hypothetical protein